MKSLSQSKMFHAEIQIQPCISNSLLPRQEVIHVLHAGYPDKRQKCPLVNKLNLHCVLTKHLTEVLSSLFQVLNTGKAASSLGRLIFKMDLNQSTDKTFKKVLKLTIHLRLINLIFP